MFGRLSLLVALLGFAGSALAADPYQSATMDEVERWISAREVVVYDVNPDEVYAKNHLPGARFVTGKKWTASLPADKGARLVFYCSNPK
jgi:rhodanese-related sulfurtransferase